MVLIVLSHARAGSVGENLARSHDKSYIIYHNSVGHTGDCSDTTLLPPTGESESLTVAQEVDRALNSDYFSLPEQGSIYLDIEANFGCSSREMTCSEAQDVLTAVRRSFAPEDLDRLYLSFFSGSEKNLVAYPLVASKMSMYDAVEVYVKGDDHPWGLTAGDLTSDSDRASRVSSSRSRKASGNSSISPSARSRRIRGRSRTDSDSRYKFEFGDSVESRPGMTTLADRDDLPVNQDPKTPAFGVSANNEMQPKRRCRRRRTKRRKYSGQGPIETLKQRWYKNEKWRSILDSSFSLDDIIVLERLRVRAVSILVHGVQPGQDNPSIETLMCEAGSASSSSLRVKVEDSAGEASAASGAGDRCQVSDRPVLVSVLTPAPAPAHGTSSALTAEPNAARPAPRDPGPCRLCCWPSPASVSPDPDEGGDMSPGVGH